ncbi:hypothetical protein GQ53DRAFT_130763 [Thozetella sp. PMI_491]|nr:hypothetical protein GQ53DRAFT_130763 [Thozetella sp. PMI_491]
METKLEPKSGNRIALKACDFCRARKCQCIFENVDDPSCQKCIRSNVQCTFLKGHKVRGPKAARLPTELPLPLANITVDQFCSSEMLVRLLSDYHDFVFPLFPLVHWPSFQSLVDDQAWNTDGAFLRFCLSLCALTVASIPSNIETYGGERYHDVRSMVDRASDLVIISRLQSDPHWHDQPTLQAILESTLLSMALHYCGRPQRGWSFANEAIVALRELKLYCAEGYARLSPMEGELAKRAFWLLYIIQVHDRLTSVVPHTVLSFLPAHTDWLRILPLAVSDDELSSASLKDDGNGSGNSANDGRILMIGFVGLIKIFVCLWDLVSGEGTNPILGPYPFRHVMPPSHQQPFPTDKVMVEDDKTSNRAAMSSLTIVLQVMRRMNQTIIDLPPELQFPAQERQHIASPSDHQFDIMRTTLHITSIYLQSTVLEICLSSQAPRLSKEIGSPSYSQPANQYPADAANRSTQALFTAPDMLKLRETIAEELLRILRYTSVYTLERNGLSLMHQIRKVAATLLDREDGREILSDMGERSRLYLRQFAEILANLDHSFSLTVS